MQIRKKWFNHLKNFFNKHFTEYYLASFCWWIPSSCENHCNLLSITNNEITQNSKSEPKKFSILCTFKSPESTAAFFCNAENSFNILNALVWCDTHVWKLNCLRQHASTFIIEIQRSIRRYISCEYYRCMAYAVRTVHISILMEWCQQGAKYITGHGGRGGAAQRRKQRLRLKKLALI
jgi:hypothetical protein